MAYNHDNGLNEERVAAFLQDAVKNVESATDADIKAFEQIKKLIKKNVPFTRRKYVYAFLVKNATSSFRGNRFGKEKNEKFTRGQRNSRENSSGTEEKRERTPRIRIDSSDSATIFIGIGHNRRVAPRDLVGLLVSVANLEKTRIGEIRVLANYSFIQLYKDDCEKAISALNGYEYRGRKLSVSYSRKREDELGESEISEVSKVSATEVKNDEVFEKSKITSEKSYSFNEEEIPANISNEGHADTSLNTEEAKIAAEQKAFAAEQKASSSADLAKSEEKPFSETTDDGQVKSHFGDGAAY